MEQTRRDFVKTLFVASQGIVASRFLTTNLFAKNTVSTSSSQALNFLVFGDWGRGGELDQTQVATQMAKASKDISARFIISVGDNFYENGVTSIDDKHWRKSFEDVYAAPSLQIPWYVILGNHDYHGNCDAQIDYGKTSKRWNMPARYFTRTEKINDATTVDFFYLDTTPMSKLDDDEVQFHGNVKWNEVPKQIAWFEAALKASTAPWKIVIGHHPVFSGGQHGDTPYIVENILPLLEKYKVQAYFNGHDHDLQHLQSNGINFFCSGGGSKPREAVQDIPQTKFGKGCSGFTTVSLQADKMNVGMIDNFGTLLYTTIVSRNSA